MFDEKKPQKTALAANIMDYVRNQLVVLMPFFSRSLLKMPLEFYEAETSSGLTEGFGTNGITIYCNYNKVLKLFEQEKNILFRTYLHMIYHCIFHHPFQYDNLIRSYWDFAADIAVEYAISELKWQDLQTSQDAEQQRIIEKLKPKLPQLTAENIYHFFLSNEEEATSLLTNASLFQRDLHAFWIPDKDNVTKRYPKNPHPGIGKISEEWKRLGASAKLDVQVFEWNHGMAPGSLSETLTVVPRDKYNYEEFLRKFAILSEETHINHDEFDYVYYTYGMQLYGNMPLVEPLEYRETKKIKDFVIAIDTSGSCQGRTVRSFLNKTYAILKSTKSFFEQVHIHIIQCDSKIQQETTITCEEDLKTYMAKFTVHGYGGTDFRPVFARTEELIRQRKLTDLKGLIYFTDGMGIFPEKMPSFQTAFIFIKNRYSIPKIPSWAMKLTLYEDELQEDEEIEYQ